MRLPRPSWGRMVGIRTGLGNRGSDPGWWGRTAAFPQILVLNVAERNRPQAGISIPSSVALASTASGKMFLTR